MSTWMALHFELRPGSEDEVSSIFANSGRPEHTVRDEQGNEIGRLLRTLVFVGKGRAVRVIEIDGDVMAVSRHMSQQQEVQELEALLDKHLAKPRDMTNPAGAAAFFAEAGMRCVVHRQADE
jgi:hypothetical protein